MSQTIAVIEALSVIDDRKVLAFVWLLNLVIVLMIYILLKIQERYNEEVSR